MRGPEHDRLREMTAAHVLGALDAADRAELEAHLAGCETCRRDVVAFAPLPALLARVDPADLEVPVLPDGAGPVVIAVRGELHRLHRRERWWRLAAAAAAAALVVVGTMSVLGDDDPGPARSGGVELAVTGHDGSDAEVVADERPWGTYVHLAADGLPERPRYSIWAVDRAGRWEPVGSWTATADGRVELGCSTARPLAEIDRVVVTSADRSDVLLVARA